MNPHLIEWAAAHKIAYQAAAAFRPSYFDGPGFMAHPWVVEAIRSAHMDGERYAQGLPPIDRSGALPIEVREQRLAKRALPSSDEPKWTAELVATVERLAEEIRAKLEPKPMADPTPQPSDAPQQGADVTIYMDAGDLRQVLNGNDMPAWCSTTEAHGTVKLATQPAEQGEDAARWRFILESCISGNWNGTDAFQISYVPAGNNGNPWSRIEVEFKWPKWAHITAADVNAVIDAAKAAQGQKDTK